VLSAISAPPATHARPAVRPAALNSKSVFNLRPSSTLTVRHVPVVSTRRLVWLVLVTTPVVTLVQPRSSAKLPRLCPIAPQATFATLRLTHTPLTLRTKLSLAHSVTTALKVLHLLFCAPLVLSRTRQLLSKSLNALCASQANTATMIRESLRDAHLALIAQLLPSSQPIAPRELSSHPTTSLVLMIARCA